MLKLCTVLYILYREGGSEGRSEGKREGGTDQFNVRVLSVLLNWSVAITC